MSADSYRGKSRTVALWPAATCPLTLGIFHVTLIPSPWWSPVAFFTFGSVFLVADLVLRWRARGF